MCFSSLVLSRRPTIFKKRPKTLKNPLTPIGSCRDLHTRPLWCHRMEALYGVVPYKVALTCLAKVSARQIVRHQGQGQASKGKSSTQGHA